MLRLLRRSVAGRRNRGACHGLCCVVWLIAVSALHAVSAVAQNADPIAGADGQTPAASVNLGRYYALVIGINAYPDPVPRLKTAVGDAQAIAKVLTDRYGFETRVLLDKDATREHILQTLSHYENVLGENDSLLIYYAGHGFQNKVANKTYWLPADANSMQSSNRISADDLTTEMATLRARHVLVISDSCYSGGLTRGLNDTTTSKGEKAFLRKMMEGRSRNLMASGGDEPVADGGPDGHSIFAYAVLTSLESSEQSMFTASDLFYGSVQRMVAGNAEQVPLYAPIRNSGDAAGDFVFRRVGISLDEEQQKLAAQAAGYNRALELYQTGKFFDAARLAANSCDSGDGRSCAMLGYFFESGKGTAIDLPQAVALYKKGCDAGDGLGCFDLGLLYNYGKGVTTDLVQAAALYRKGCDEGENRGCSNLGLLYEQGRGVVHDATKATELYRKSCDGGNPRRCSNLGVQYENGTAVPRDLTQAAALYRQGCDGGDEIGCSDLGIRYELGGGVSADAVQAAVLYRKGCDGGSGLGCSRLGGLYEKGLGMAADVGQAAAFYRKGCELGNAVGCSDLGVLYQNGKGLTADPGQAAALFGKACESGAAHGCGLLGVLYLGAPGVVADYAQAAAFFRKGCDGGDAPSCAALALCYESGAGVAQDLAQADALYGQSCDAGIGGACAALGKNAATGVGMSKDPARAAVLYQKACALKEQQGCDALKR